jgi:hypothetical protein
MSRKRDRVGLFFAKTPHEALFIHVTCYAASMYVIDFICALSFGEAHPRLSTFSTARREPPSGISARRVEMAAGKRRETPPPSRT